MGGSTRWATKLEDEDDDEDDNDRGGATFALGTAAHLLSETTSSEAAKECA